MQRKNRFGVSHLTVISSAYKLVLAATFAGFIGTVLKTACVGKDAVLDAVDLEPTPGLLALQKGRYVLSKGISCYWGDPPPSPPRVSVLLAKDRIWIGLSFGDIWEFPYQHDPQDRLWKIRNVVDGYDWPAARESLLEVRELLTNKSPEMEVTEPVNQDTITSPARNEAMESASIAGILGLMREPISADFHDIEIAAESEVPYSSILGAMDLAVATQFTSIGYVEPMNLPEWFKE